MLYGPTVQEASAHVKRAPCQLADMQAFCAVEIGNNADEVSVELVRKHAYEDDSANDYRDGLNRRLRQLRPPRQRPKKG